MTIELDIQQETAVPELVENALRSAAIAVQEHEELPAASVTVLLTDDEALRSLNRQYRSEDKTTDVLSFSFGDDPVPLGDDQVYLGDIAISVPYAHRQAEERGHSTTAELQLLMIHGMLHLLGYDHEDAETKKTMWVVQRELLDQLGLAHVEPTEG